MSTVFQIVCLTHEERGPKIRRTAGLTAVLQLSDRPALRELDDESAETWGRFLVDHEFCDLRLERGP